MAPHNTREDDRLMRPAYVGLCVGMIVTSAIASSLSNQPQTSISSQPKTSLSIQPKTSISNQPKTSLSNHTSLSNQTTLSNQTSLSNQTFISNQTQTPLFNQTQTSLSIQPQTSLSNQISFSTETSISNHTSLSNQTSVSNQASLSNQTSLSNQPLTYPRPGRSLPTDDVDHTAQNMSTSTLASLVSPVTTQTTTNAVVSTWSTVHGVNKSSTQLVSTSGTIGIDGIDEQAGMPGDPPRWFQYFGTARCSDDEYTCLNGHCINESLLNDDHFDCFHKDDEDNNIRVLDVDWCERFQYVCRDTLFCVMPRLLCDGVEDCPRGDDEPALCRAACPAPQCRCGASRWFRPFYRCTAPFPLPQHPMISALDMSHTPGIADFIFRLKDLRYLRFLNVSHCQLTRLTLLNMRSLQILDMGHNRLTHIRDVRLKRLHQLKWLNLSNNRMLAALDSSFAAFLRLADMYYLTRLFLRSTGMASISDRAMEPLSSLQELDISQNRIDTAGRYALQGLSNLTTLVSDDTRLCCPYFKRGALDLPVECVAPEDALSSCEDLLRSDFFRISLWLLAALAVAGNGGVLLYRVLLEKRTGPPAFSVLVKSLCAADLLMGVYLAGIGTADALFRGEYVVRAPVWRRSQVCWAAGVLGFVSSEVSALVIGAITLDRVLVLCCPLRASLHLTARSALALSVALWSLGALLAAVPLLAGLEFYDQTGLCLPLPISSRTFSGQGYAFAIFIVLNMLIFLAILGGQLAIFVAVRVAGSASGTGGEQRRAQEASIARRLLLVVLSDFCCWFPVGLLGLLAKGGVPISDSVNVWTAVFVLPLNSALNPFLYTLNAILDMREKRRMEMRVKKMFRRLKVEIPKMEASKVEEVVRVCIQCKSVKRDRLARLLGLEPVTHPHLEGSQTEDGPPSPGLEPVTHPHLEGSQTEDGPPSHGLEPVTHPHLEGSQTEDGPPSRGLEPDTHPHIEGSQTEDRPPSYGLGKYGPPSQGLGEDGPLSNGLPEDGPPSHGLPQDGPLSNGLGEDGSPSHGLPEDGPPSHGLPEDRSLSHGLPEDGPPSHELLEDGPPSLGLPEDGPPCHGLPEDGPPSHELPEDGPPSLGLPEDGPPCHGLPEDGPPSHELPEDGPPSLGLPEDGPLSHGLPEDGPPSLGLPEDGPLSHGLPEDGPPSSGFTTASLWDRVTLDAVVQEV